MKLLATAFLFCFAIAIPIHGQVSTTRLEGQVVCCAECWAEADRTKVEYGTAENLLKARSCVERDPTLLAVREGANFKLYQLATGKFRLLGKNWLEFVGKRVAVNGTVKTQKETNIIRVDSLEVLALSLAEREAAKVSGQQIDLSLKDLSGIEQSISGLRGRVVVLNFWATYCIPCRKEMPDLAAIQNEFGALGLQVIGVSTDDPEARSKVLQFVKETKINFPIWVGGSIEDMVRFGLGEALPGTVIIGRDGKVKKVYSGVINAAELRKQVEILLTVAPDNLTPGTREVATAAKPKSAPVSSVPS